MSGWRFFNSLFLLFLDEISADLVAEDKECFEILAVFKAYYNRAGPEAQPRRTALAGFPASRGDDEVKMFSGEVVVMHKMSICEYVPKTLDWEKLILAADEL